MKCVYGKGVAGFLGVVGCRCRCVCVRTCIFCLYMCLSLWVGMLCVCHSKRVPFAFLHTISGSRPLCLFLLVPDTKAAPPPLTFLLRDPICQCTFAD